MFSRSWGNLLVSGFWSRVFGFFLQVSPPSQPKMSPAIAHAGAAASKDVKKESATARLLGSGEINK